MTVSTAHIIFEETKVFDNQITQELERETKQAAQKIDHELERIMTLVDNFEVKVSSTAHNAQLPAILKDEFETETELFSLNITFKLYLYQPQLEYFSPYYERLSGPTQYFDLADYDQRKVEFSWFYRPLEEGAIWTEPYYEPVNDVLMTTYSVPFYRSSEDKKLKQNAAGVIPSDVNLVHLTEALKEMKLGMNGYSMIFSQQHNLISHPVFSLVRQGESYDSLLQKPDWQFLPELSHCLSADQSYQFIDDLDIDDHAHFATCIKIPHTDWTMITILSKDRFAIDEDKLRQDYMKALAYLIFTLFFVACVLSRADRIKYLSWRFSIFLSIMLAVGTILIWLLARDFYGTGLKGSTSIINMPQRAAFIEAYEHQVEQMRLEKPVFISTGLQISSLEFLSANNLRFSGHVWQKVDPEVNNTLGVTFPDAVIADIREVYRKPLAGGRQVVGWHFSVELRHLFDYSKYPFDHKNVRLRILPAEMNGRVLLKPDLESYEQINPTANPAVLPDIVLNGWQMISSQFNYMVSFYNSNYGWDAEQRVDQVPELYYSIELEREFLSPFVTTLLPVLVIVGLLFAAIISMPYSQYDEFRNNTTAIIFTILLVHYSIRERLSISEVVYFEYFYFLLYLVISIFLLIAHQYYNKGGSKLLKYNNNKFSSIWYWPFITGSVFVMTLLTYY